MPLQTTVVGAWPKPEYLALPDWFKSKLAATGGKCSCKYHIPKILKSLSYDQRYYRQIFRAHWGKIEILVQYAFKIKD